MNRTLFALLGLLVVLAVFLALLTRQDVPEAPIANKVPPVHHEPLELFCAASNRAVMEAIRIDYEREYQTPIQVQYGASQTLLSSLEVSGTGDLYLPADDSYLEMARDKTLVNDTFPLATMKAIVAVHKGNPKAIHTLQDLSRQDVKLVQANPDAAAIGKVVREALSKSAAWNAVATATTAYRTNVNEVANDLVIGAADVGFIYDAMLFSYPDLEMVAVNELAMVTAQVSLGVIATSKQREAALRFARYASASDRGLLHYATQGFTIVPGQPWKE